MKKNLVMGVAKGYDWDTLEPFVLSCKKNCPSVELLLFVDDISDFTRDQLIWGGCRLENFPAEMRTGVPNNTRWKIFSDFLEQFGANYYQVLISDTRDVIFQEDVFEKFKDYKNFLGYTTEADDIGGSKTGAKVNYGWLTDSFGKEEAQKLSAKKIICDGTVIGSVAEMKIFAKKMWHILNDIMSRVDFRIHDQSIANYIIYENLLPIKNLIEIDTDTGEIFTVGYADNFFVHGDKIFRNGGVPAVVHQYDRKEKLLQLVDEIYHDKNFQADERFNDTRSVIEQTTSLLRADKTGEATRLFLKKYLSDIDFSKFGGALIRLWDTALKKPPSQTLELLEIAVQSSAKSCKYFSGYIWYSICEMMKRAKRNNRPIDADFKIYVANTIWEMAEQCLKSNQPETCFDIIKTIEELDMPPNKNFYLFAAKANRIFGRKEEALSAYKKVLELS